MPSSLDRLAITAMLAMFLARQTMELWLAASFGLVAGYFLARLFYDY